MRAQRTENVNVFKVNSDGNGQIATIFVHNHQRVWSPFRRRSSIFVRFWDKDTISRTTCGQGGNRHVDKCSVCVCGGLRCRVQTEMSGWVGVEQKEY